MNEKQIKYHVNQMKQSLSEYHQYKNTDKDEGNVHYALGRLTANIKCLVEEINK